MVGCENAINPTQPQTQNDNDRINLAKGGGNSCVTLQDGTLLYTTGFYLGDTPIPVGYDEYGYNYQAHMFNGSYFNNAANKNGYPPWKGDDAAYLAENPGAE